MADKNSVADWDTTPINNDNVGGVPLGENIMRPPNVNNAFRVMMAQLKTVYNTTVNAVLFTAQSKTVEQRTQAHENVGSEYVLISEQTVSNAADVRFYDLAPYDELLLKCEVAPVGGGANLYFRGSSDNGATFKSGASDYYTTSWFGRGAAVGSSVLTAAALGYMCSHSIADIASSGYQTNKFEWSISDFNKTSTKAFRTEGLFFDSTGSWVQSIVGGIGVAGVLNALLVGTAGRPITGHLRLYGRKG